MMGKERGSGGERGKVGNERYNNRGDASAHLWDHLLCSVEANLIVPFTVHVFVSVFVFGSIKRVFACLQVYFPLHPLSPVCMCVEPAFRQLFGLAGGALSQSLIYSGPFEIIELTHLSDGERRNAKRSPGEVPAAPAPNLSCLQIAQSLHHNRWDSCLSFLPHSHTHSRARTEGRTHKCSKHPSHLSTRMHTYTQKCSHSRHLSQARQANRQRHVLYTSADTHVHTNTHIYSLPLSLSVLPSPAHSVLLSLQVWFPCTRSVSAVYREHHSLMPRARQKDKRHRTKDKRQWRRSLCSLPLYFSLNFLYLISELLFNDISLKDRIEPFGHRESDA